MSADARTNEDLLDVPRNGDEGDLIVLVEDHRDRRKRLKDVVQGMPPGIEGI